MTTTDFSTTLLLDQSPAEVFQAITQVRDWWSTGIKGNTTDLNDEFIFEVKGVHYSRQKLVEVVPNRKIVWLVTESHLSFLKERTEWTGTKVVFEIEKVGRQTQLVFTHEGLVPEVECYEACTPAWTQYIQHSLHQLITTGKGDPNLEGREIQAIDNPNFTTSLVINQTPREVFDAITNVRGWWSQEIEGKTAKTNDEFSYHYKDVHRCRIKVVEAIEGRRVEWLVLDNYFNFIQDQSEWKGTRIIFEILKRGSQTEFHFTHEGLVSAYECYDVCVNAWTDYIQNSLKNLIVTGQGQPNQREGR